MNCDQAVLPVSVYITSVDLIEEDADDLRRLGGGAHLN
jgi:hypothetical protein